MIQKQKRGTTFYCFSPPVMLATFLIEISLCVYVLVRFRLTPLTRLAAALLLLLSLFQFAEFNVCARAGLEPSTWSRVGFVAISLLPALALHLTEMIARRKHLIVLGTAYVTAAFWVVLFLTSGAIAGNRCVGNYAIFQIRQPISIAYYVYYYGWLLIGLVLCAYYIAHTKRKAERWALALQAIGYCSFMLPTAVANSLKPSTLEGLPSIMCGFAVAYALIIAFGILPCLFADRTRRRG